MGKPRTKTRGKTQDVRCFYFQHPKPVEGRVRTVWCETVNVDKGNIKECFIRNCIAEIKNATDDHSISKL